MRSENIYIIVDCVPGNSKAPTSHRHNSRLSFELFSGDKGFIVDPGSYVYTADFEKRNLFRSTAYHNTVVVDNEEQNRFDTAELFRIGHDADVKINKWEIAREYDLLDAEHSGYKRLDKPIVHRRQVVFNKVDGYWIIKDFLGGKGTHRYDLYFHFAPLAIELDSDYPLVVRTVTEGTNLVVIPLEVEGLSVEVGEGWVSCRYGIKEEAPVVKYTRRGETPAYFCSILYPYTGIIDIAGVIESVRKSVTWQLLEG